MRFAMLKNWKIAGLGQLDRIQLIAIVNLPSVLRWLGRTNLHLNSQCSLALRHARSLACFPVSARRIRSPPLTGSLEPFVSDDVQHYPNVLRVVHRHRDDG